MKNVFRFFLIIGVILVTACEKKEVIYQVEEEVAAANLTARIMNCSFRPGLVSTVTGLRAGFRDGPLYKAEFFFPDAIAFDEHRQIIYVADWDNNRIRAIKDNMVTTFVGGIRGDTEGVGSAARLNDPIDLAIDKKGNLFVADRGNHKIRVISPDGNMKTLAGTRQGYADGRGNAKFSLPWGITIDVDGTLYVADEGNDRIRYIKSDGSVGTLAGSKAGFRDSNNPYDVQFNKPRGVEIGPDGNIYVADSGNNRIRRVTKRRGRTTTFAGGRIGSMNGSLSRATFNNPTSIVCDKAGNFFVVDTSNHRIRFIHRNEVGTLAGSLIGDIDGNYEQARFRYPTGIAIINDDLYIADASNHSIRRIAMEYDCN